MTSESLPVIVWESFLEIVKANIVYELMTSLGFALSGMKEMPTK
jgi:hypothetical protein